MLCSGAWCQFLTLLNTLLVPEIAHCCGHAAPSARKALLCSPLGQCHLSTWPWQWAPLWKAFQAPPHHCCRANTAF
jgi:hypothetical protein